ncbi:hypothetical protein [Geodermatophilus ruber]|uniref:PfkB family carbohydrate kinase n=1 Tax=Geodermatophilus ruber TaxID=504800 RepID=A0A1I3Z1B6_9ACTN|nr:hypothetical protein [Geodermatophilus ruber]SFK37883.1 hypothetical protein SAMN04488085_101300 [Geodermatophilus ruber]
MEHPLDVPALGRSGVDVYPLQIGVGLEDVETFGKYLGGSAANVSVAAAWEARGRRGHTVLDLDYRPMFWSSPEEAGAQVRGSLPHVTVAVGNREECAVAVGETDPDRAAGALLEAGVELAVIAAEIEALVAVGAPRLEDSRA